MSIQLILYDEALESGLYSTTGCHTSSTALSKLALQCLYTGVAQSVHCSQGLHISQETLPKLSAPALYGHSADACLEQGAITSALPWLQIS